MAQDHSDDNQHQLRGAAEDDDRRLMAAWAPVVRAGVLGCVGALALALVLGVREMFGIGVPYLAGSLALAGILTGVGLYRRSLPSSAVLVVPWLLIACGVAVLAATNAGTAMGSAGGAGSWWRGLAALAAYPFLTVGLLRLLRGRLPDRDADVLVEAGLVATLFGLAIWVLISHPRGHDVPVSVLMVWVALLALDLVLVTITIRLLLLPGERMFVYRAVGLALCYLLVSHLTAMVGAVSGWQVSQDLVRLLLVCSFGFWALAALHPSMRQLFEPLTGDPPTFSAGHLVLTQMGMLAAPAVIGVQALRHEMIPTAVAVGVGVLSAVLAVYLGSLLWQRTTIEHRAHHDQLTGLPNRSLFIDRVSRALAHALRNELPVAIIFVDLDRFKEVNDSLGHAAGDELLRQVARRLESCVREEDTVARLGGDEFALLLPHVSGLEGAERVAERILEAFTSPIGLAKEQVVVGLSVGISLHPEDGADAQTLIAGADAAMYGAKERGRNTYEIFSPVLRTQAQERLAMESALHQALERGELVLHYQPKVDLRSGAITGAEALVRWNHPERGLLLPGAFVPVAEQSGQVVALGEFVLAAACEQLQSWQSDGLPLISVSVNVSARQLRHGLVEFTAAALRHTALGPHQLELELTESAALESLDITIRELEELRAMGVRCTIDDFGTGYCGLSYLSQLPIDGLKIDKSFIHAVSDTAASIVAAIIALGHSLGLTVTGEGVETSEQLACLVRHDCDEMQGYLFSRPIPAEAFARLVLDHAPGGPGRLPVGPPATTDPPLVVAESRAPR